MDDFFKPKFFNKRILSIKKIKLNERPDIRKYLTKFFDNPDSFFLDKFKNQKVVLGKKIIDDQKFEVPIPKHFNRRFFVKRRSTMKLQQSSFLSESKFLSHDTSSIRGERRRGYKDLIELIQNNGKRYISDSEIEEIFNAFKKVHEINKNRVKDFITTKEFIDNNYINCIDENFINNYNFLNGSTSRKTSNELINAINSKKNHRFALSENNFEIKTGKEIKNQKNFNNIFHSQPSSVKNNNDDVFNIIDNSAGINTKKFMKTSKSFFNKNNKNIKKKENSIYEKQNQFLTSIKCNIGKKEMAKKLASQEKILLSKSKSQSEISELYNFLSVKSNKKQTDLLLETIEDYREFKDLKLKINDLIKKKNPNENYNWSDNLRIMSRNKSEPEYSKLDEIVINNKNKTLTNFFKGQSEYLKRKITKARYKALMHNLIKTKENLNGLEIKGQNLLKFEHDIIKKLKGKKVIINFNNKYSNPLEINTNLYASDFNFNTHVK